MASGPRPASPRQPRHGPRHHGDGPGPTGPGQAPAGADQQRQRRGGQEGPSPGRRPRWARPPGAGARPIPPPRTTAPRTPASVCQRAGTAEHGEGPRRQEHHAPPRWPPARSPPPARRRAARPIPRHDVAERQARAPPPASRARPTAPPTSRRRREARARGSIPISEWRQARRGRAPRARCAWLRPCRCTPVPMRPSARSRRGR